MRDPAASACALDLQARIMRNLARRHVQHICPAQTVGHQVVPHATYPMGDPTSYKRALSGQSDEPCFPYQARGGHRGDAAGTPWRLRHSCHPTQLASQLDDPRVATVYTNAPERLREVILANLCTLLRSHGRSRDRVGLGAPRHRRPHDPRDARALGPEAHAAGAVTQPPTYTNSRSLLVRSSQLQSHSELQKSDLAAHPARFNRLEQIRAEQAYKRSRKNLKRVGLDGSAGARVGVVWWRETTLLGPIGFARAMFKHADVLYADVSTASLDRANRQMVIDLIRQRANEGRPSSLRPMTTIWQRLRTQTLPWEVSQDSSHDISCYCASCPQHRTRCHLVLQEPANVWCRGSV